MYDIEVDRFDFIYCVVFCGFMALIIISTVATIWATTANTAKCMDIAERVGSNPAECRRLK